MAPEEIEQHMPALGAEIRRRGITRHLSAGLVEQADMHGAWLRDPRDGMARWHNGPFVNAKAEEADGSRSMAIIRKG